MLDYKTREADERRSPNAQPRNLVDWTDDRIATLKKLWGEGISASQIGGVIGVSRNAVIGKAGRLKLVHGGHSKSNVRARPAGGKRDRTGNAGQPKAAAIRHRMAYRPPVLPIPLEPEEGVDVTGRHLGLLDVGAHDCKWLSGDPLAEHTFCGKPVKEGAAWCPEHHARVYLRT